MTAVANPPSYQQLSRPQWGANGQGGINAMNPDEVARMFMPRKSAQRANSSSSLSSSGSSTATATITQSSSQTTGGSMPVTGDLGGWSTAAARKRPQKAGPWPMNKSEPISGVTNTRPQSVLSTNGTSAATSMSSLQQPSAVLPSQHLMQPPTQNGIRPPATLTGEGNPVLYLLSMNGTFERKTISVPYYPDNLRIGRQTNIKTVPSPTNGYFDSKVLSRSHAEIWADRNGKVFIRDVRSSNGTFVNGARLSAENRDSEPHELQSQDHLELGIDIVSEDQKTVVHHKVAAKVEHAGFLGPTNNVLDMNFGDLDPANGSIMLGQQNGTQMRGRTSSQGSIGSNGRMGPPGSIAASNLSLGAQRPMNFWLTPVTTEQIVKRLTHEMRTARLQINELGRTENFFETLLSKEEFRDDEKSDEGVDYSLMNGASASLRMEGKTRFSEPPAPPPQQPLPEMPELSRSAPHDLTTPSLKRISTERPLLPQSDSSGPTSQIITLVAELDTKKREVDSQSARIRDLEEMLQREREARETAEKHAKRLELSASSNAMNGHAKEGVKGGIIEEAFEPPLDSASEDRLLAFKLDPESTTSTESVEISTTILQQKLDLMMDEMRDMKQMMESYRQRAEIAESERDSDRKTLAEMVAKIRLDEQTRRSSSTERARSPATLLNGIKNEVQNGKVDTSDEDYSLHELAVRNGKAIESADVALLNNPMAFSLSRPPGSYDPLLYHSTPYASMLGVVLLGMGVMAYMNGWQKVER